ncbi:MAG TPA: hypothetical protein VKP00_13755 [Gemmatimonadaceae bacterium]|nr:hypothetical protein [Gemmatimonadaceae bacterium]
MLSLHHHARRARHAVYATRVLEAGDVRRVLVVQADLKNFATMLRQRMGQTKMLARRGTVNRVTIETKRNWQLLSV